MPAEMIPDGSGPLALGAAGASLVGIIVGVYRGIRRLRADSRSDKNDAVVDRANQTLLTQYEKTIEGQQKRLDDLQDRFDRTTKDLSERADKMAAERNAALVQNAAYVERIDNLTKEVARLNAELKELTGEFDELAQKNGELVARNEVLTDEPAKPAKPAKPTRPT